MYYGWYSDREIYRGRGACRSRWLRDALAEKQMRAYCIAALLVFLGREASAGEADCKNAPTVIESATG